MNLVDNQVHPDDLPDCIDKWFYLRVLVLSDVPIDLEVPLRLLTFSYAVTKEEGLALWFEEAPGSRVTTIQWRNVVAMKPLAIGEKAT